MTRIIQDRYRRAGLPQQDARLTREVTGVRLAAMSSSAVSSDADRSYLINILGTLVIVTAMSFAMMVILLGRAPL